MKKIWLILIISTTTSAIEAGVTEAVSACLSSILPCAPTLDSANGMGCTIAHFIYSGSKGPFTCTGTSCDLTEIDFHEDLALIAKSLSTSSGIASCPGVTLADIINHQDGVDLSGATLSAANLSGLTLPHLNLTGADLSPVFYDGEDHATNLSGLNAAGATFQGTIFNGANLSNGMFYGSSMKEASFGNTNLSNSDLAHVDLEGAGFYQTNLDKVNFQFATLTGLADTVTFDNGTTVAAGIKTALNLGTADYTGAILSGIDLSSSGVPGDELHIPLHAPGSHLEGANFNYTDMSNSGFYGAIMTGATMHGTNLTGANFQTAQLDSTDFSESTLVNTTLDNIICYMANFSGATMTNFSMTSADCSNPTPPAPGSNAPWAANSTFNGATISNDSVSKPAFNGTMLPNADFRNSNITNINFTNTNIVNSLFNGTTMDGVDWSSTNLTNAIFGNMKVGHGGIINFINTAEPTTILAGSTLTEDSTLGHWLGNNLQTNIVGNWMATQCKSGIQPVCAAFCHMPDATKIHQYDANGNDVTLLTSYEACHPLKLFNVPNYSVNKVAANSNSNTVDYWGVGYQQDPNTGNNLSYQTCGVDACSMFVYKYNMQMNQYKNDPIFNSQGMIPSTWK